MINAGQQSTKSLAIGHNTANSNSAKANPMITALTPDQEPGNRKRDLIRERTAGSIAKRYALIAKLDVISDNYARKLNHAYLITGIPKFILLDKEGKIINSRMTYPSDPRTKEILNSLEGL